MTSEDYAKQVTQVPNVTFYIVLVVRIVSPAPLDMGNIEDGNSRGNSAMHERAVMGCSDRVRRGGKQNRPFATIVGDVPGDGEMRAVAVYGRPGEVEAA